MNRKILVNKQKKLKKGSLKKIHLHTYYDADHCKACLEKKTYKAFLKLQESIFLKTGIVMHTAGAFRTPHHQATLYHKFVQQYGREYADTVVAPVYASEHHTGLAFDANIQIDGVYLKDNYETEKYIDIYEKMHPFLAQYGFILRYPKGKEAITGYPYEPWHFRYVGKKLAKTIMQESLTLEEFYQKKRKKGPTRKYRFSLFYKRG